MATSTGASGESESGQSIERERAESPPLEPSELERIAREAYVFGYPLVLMDVTRAVSTAVARPAGTKAPANRFAHVRAFPDPSFKEVVSPNADTLYSVAWLDLSREPIVLSVPDTGGRYYLMPMLDAWTNVFASPGERTTGTGKHDFAIVGPGWQGELPAGLERIDAPTPTVWIIGRTYTAGPADYAAVHAIQDQYTLTPLGRWGGAYAPPDVSVEPGVDLETPPAEQVARMDARTFFDRLARLLERNPPAEEDDPALDGMARLGVVPGQAFEPAQLGARAEEILQEAGDTAREAIAEEARTMGEEVNGWHIDLDLGCYGTRYLARAAVAMVGLGANLPEDAVYPMVTADAEGKLLDGRHAYQLRFEAGQLPPVDAFWSITLYDEHQFFVANPLDRYTLGDRSGLRREQDGALVITFQNQRPGPEVESNWLPAPAGPFNLIMRLYHPKAEVLDGRWSPPPVRRRKS
jgi:hypothetical protein